MENGVDCAVLRRVEEGGVEAVVAREGCSREGRSDACSVSATPSARDTEWGETFKGI